MTSTILHIDSSAQLENSASRTLSKHIVMRLAAGLSEPKVLTRDTSDDAQFIDSTWVAASFSPKDERTLAMESRLQLSDRQVDEVTRASYIVIGLPLYNFNLPATLKSWVDQIARPGLTFAVHDNGYEGLLTNKQVYLAVVSGSTDVEGPMDFATPYLKHALGFLGMVNVTVFSASNLVIGDRVSIMRQAMDSIDSAFSSMSSVA